MDRLGFGYDQVRCVAPRTIYCSVSGYGQVGPKSGRAGHDLNYLGEVGLLSMVSPRTAMPAAPFADIAGGAYPAIINILLALIEQDRTGAGCHLQISITDNLFPLLYFPWSKGFASGNWPVYGEDIFWGASARYNLYPTKDDGVLVVAALEEKFWIEFCSAIGLAAYAETDEQLVT